MHKSDAEYLVLKKLENNPYLTQRQISKELGVSLGKTNYVIKALTDKGWLKLHKDSSETAFPALIMTNLVHIFCDHRLN